ncbi:MAG: MBL fold metallo-hydrolase [candidate division Zixibacteria bacterium]|nr:MBL fold metallo-hydrolase [candidate division Zixibacteria bacterium]
MKKFAFLSLLLVFVLINSGFAQELTIHCINIGQGDCTLIESPNGTTMMVDNGPYQSSSHLIDYLTNIGITTIDYLVISHYHSDHIGATNILINEGFEIGVCYDRGWSYCSSNYGNYYEPSIRNIRETIEDGQVIDLGNGVTATCVAVNGNGVIEPPFIDSDCPGGGDNGENDFSVALVVDYHEFQYFVGGDLSGINNSNYTDIETSVGPEAGDVEVYYVDHHGSYANSNQNFLNTIDPEVSIIPCGQNGFGHPHPETMQRLRATSEVYQYADDSGNPIDGDIVIRTPGENYFIVNGDYYPIGLGSITPMADIQDNYDEYEGRPVTVEGIVTVGIGILNPFTTDAYFEDNSGKGINIFDLGTIDILERGNKVRLSGLVGEHNGITQIYNIANSQVFSPGNELPGGHVATTGDAEDFSFEGTRLLVSGAVLNIEDSDSGLFITIDDGSGMCQGFCHSLSGVDLDWIDLEEWIALNGVLRVYANNNDTTYAILIADTLDVYPATSVSENASAGRLPGQFILHRNSPNPFNNITNISYTIRSGGEISSSSPALVQLEVFNIFGQKTATIDEGYRPPGKYTVKWRAANSPSGVYFYQLSIENHRLVRKMILLK